MKPLIVILFLGVLLFSFSCNLEDMGGLRKKNLHDRYGQMLIKAGLKETTLGQLWFTEATRALQTPETVSLPFRQIGYFAGDKPRAVGLRFTAPRGSKLIFQLQTKALDTFKLYTDLWRLDADGDPKLLKSIDSTKGVFSYEMNDDDDTLLLRLQPELLSSGEYTLSISVGPSLAFPVGGGKGHIGSFWGVPRDAGARRHEGIDIFAPRRTPAVAAADGWVYRVGTNHLGGNVIFLRPDGKNISLYYAHLDQQLVRSGDRVHKGDTIGLVGNTGNARTTPPHLHFGIYTMGGAINPLAFVNPVIKHAPTLSIEAKELNRYYRTTHIGRSSNISLEPNTILLATDISSAGLVGRTAGGKIVALPLSEVQVADNQLVIANMRDTISLLEAPTTAAPTKRKLLPGSAVRVQGYYKDFAFVSDQSQDRGWVPRAALR